MTPNSVTLREKCPYSDFFWSVFSLIRTQCGDSVRMGENTDQKHSEYRHILRSIKPLYIIIGNAKGYIE